MGSEPDATATLLTSTRQKDPLPQSVFVELTRACNLSCQMCREPRAVPRGQRMTRQTFDLIADQLLPTAKLVDLRGWGESVILADFDYYVDRVASFGAAIRVVTNLSYRRDATLDRLSALGAYLGISLDAGDAPALAQTRRGANLELIHRNISRLSRSYATQGLLQRLCIYVTLQRPALTSLPTLLRNVADRGVTDVRLAPLTPGDSDPYGLNYTEREIGDVLPTLVRTAEQLGINLSLTASPHGPAPDSLIMRRACSHPWVSTYVAYDGRVGFCDHLIGPEGDDYTFGSLHDLDFSSIWNGSAWRALRAEHAGARRATAPYFKHCTWCYSHRFLDHEDLLNPDLASERVTGMAFIAASEVRPR